MVCPFLSQQPGNGGGGPILGEEEPGLARFLDLGSYATGVFCIVVQPELLTKRVSKAGFFRVCTSGDLRTSGFGDLSSTTVVLILSPIGSKQNEALAVCQALNSQPDAPPIVVVLHPPAAKAAWQQDGFRVAGAEELADATAEVQLGFLDAGADEVICLFDGDVVLAHRLDGVVRRCAAHAMRVDQLINVEVGALEAKLDEQMQHLRKAQTKKFIWQLPGLVLDGIPALDEKLEEVPSEGRVGGYNFVRELGKGGFGKVYLATHPVRDQVAVKAIAKGSIGDARSLLSLDREFVLMLNTPPCPHIVHAWETLHGRHNLYLVMEYAGQQNLHSYVVQMVKRSHVEALPIETTEAFCSQAAVAVAHLHQHHVCHRDVKPANMIVADKDPLLKLTDFGLATLVASKDQRLQEHCGSLPFCAPEVLRSPQSSYHGFATDIWSLGVVFVELDYGPYGVEKLLGWMPRAPDGDEKKAADLAQLPDMVLGPPPKVRSDTVARFLPRMLAVDPAARAKAHEISAGGGFVAENGKAQEAKRRGG